MRKLFNPWKRKEKPETPKDRLPGQEGYQPSSDRMPKQEELPSAISFLVGKTKSGWEKLREYWRERKKRQIKK